MAKSKRNYLVLEAHTNHPGPKTPEPSLIGFNVIGGVAAEDETKAVLAAMSVTKRLGRYAVVEATFVDFSQGLMTEPEDERPVLNP